MVRFTREVMIKPGKHLEAWKWAKEIVDYINSKESWTPCQVFRQEFGVPSKIHWFTDFEDLAALEKERVMLQEDQEYMALIIKGADFLIPGSGRDTLLRPF